MLPATPPLSCRQQHIFVHLSPDTYTSPLFTAHPADIVVATGQSAVLQCRVTGQPMPSVTWYREGGGAVETGDGISVSSSGDLVISSVTLSDDGDYYCVASNAVGSVRSLSATLDIAGTHHLLYSVAEEKRVCPVGILCWELHLYGCCWSTSFHQQSYPLNLPSVLSIVHELVYSSYVFTSIWCW